MSMKILFSDENVRRNPTENKISTRCYGVCINDVTRLVAIEKGSVYIDQIRLTASNFTFQQDGAPAQYRTYI